MDLEYKLSIELTIRFATVPLDVLMLSSAPHNSRTLDCCTARTNRSAVYSCFLASCTGTV